VAAIYIEVSLNYFDHITIELRRCLLRSSEGQKLSNSVKIQRQRHAQAFGILRDFSLNHRQSTIENEESHYRNLVF
jgi:hypothetical protein